MVLIVLAIFSQLSHPIKPSATGSKTTSSGPRRLDDSAILGQVAAGLLEQVDPEPARPFATASIASISGWSRTLAILLGLAIGLGLCLVVTVTEWGAWSLVIPGRKPAKTGDPAGLPIMTQALDGTQLAGAWFPIDDAGGRTLLMLHGLAEDRTGLLDRVPTWNARGWNVALFDARASGRSGGRRGSFGARESDDLRAWIDHLSPQIGPHPRFAAWGRSMGAATALKAAATDPRIAALILEGPYHDLRPAVAAILHRLRVPGVLARLILIRARILAGISLDRPRPIDLAHRVSAPTLILHGREDPIAPTAGARDLAAAVIPPAEILEVVGAGHANVVNVGGDPLIDQVAKFLDQAIPPR